MTHTDLLFSFALNKLTADRERLNTLNAGCVPFDGGYGSQGVGSFAAASYLGKQD